MSGFLTAMGVDVPAASQFESHPAVPVRLAPIVHLSCIGFQFYYYMYYNGLVQLELVR